MALGSNLSSAMEASTSDTLHEGANLVHEIANLRDTTLYIGGAVVLIVAIAGVILYRMHRKAVLADQQAIERAKNERARIYAAAQKLQADAIQNLTNRLDAHQKQSAIEAAAWQTALSQLSSNATTTAQTLSANTSAVSKLGDTVKVLADRVEARLPHGLSRTLVYSKAVTELFHIIVSGLSTRLYQNHYQGNEKLVEDKVRAQIRDAIQESRDALRQYPLTFEVDAVFRTYTGPSGGERFQACDLIWEKVAPLFQDTTRPVQDRVGDAAVRVEGVLKDEFDAALTRFGTTSWSRSAVVPSESEKLRRLHS